jgi:hypothetical protein
MNLNLRAVNLLNLVVLGNVKCGINVEFKGSKFTNHASGGLPHGGIWKVINCL